MRRGPGDKGEQEGRFTSDGSLSQNVCLEGCREGPWGVRQGNELSGSVIGEEGEFPLQKYVIEKQKRNKQKHKGRTLVMVMVVMMVIMMIT